MQKILPIISGLALFILCSFQGCGVLPTPKEVLPAATQTGANTFGCLVNGKVWLPKGNDGTSNLNLSYDLSYMGGVFNLQTYRYYGVGNNGRQNITIYLDSLSRVGQYNFYFSHNRAAIFSDWNKCSYPNDSTVIYKEGGINVTKLDLQGAILSGTFKFTLAKSNCDTIKVTEGRFDIKL
jgi:hypothetical protein